MRNLHSKNQNESKKEKILVPVDSDSPEILGNVAAGVSFKVVFCIGFQKIKDVEPIAAGGRLPDALRHESPTGCAHMHGH